jgi:crossover junction endodeoxyribonuclease RusA
MKSFFSFPRTARSCWRQNVKAKREYKLPWPPSVNHYWGVKGKIRFVGKRGLEFRREVMDLVPAGQCLTGRLHVKILATPPTRQRRDLDNLCKATLDALAHAGAYEDDSQIDRLEVIRLGACRPGSLRVVITEIEQE